MRHYCLVSDADTGAVLSVTAGMMEHFTAVPLASAPSIVRWKPSCCVSHGRLTSHDCSADSKVNVTHPVCVSLFEYVYIC